MSTPHPTEVNYLQAQDLLRITFSDDVTRDYPTAFLRGYCPCAHCQGHGSGPLKWNPVRARIAHTIENVTPVGAYALCILWGDGHDTGIFSFDLLRRLPIPEGWEDPGEDGPPLSV